MNNLISTIRNFRIVQNENRREIAEKPVCRDFRQAAKDAKDYTLRFCNLAASKP
jgi:hypothetical protein